MPEDQKSGFSEAVETGASAAHTIRGAIKTGKAISSAAKGAAAGGPYGAVAGAVWAGRKHIGKIIVAVIALLMLPVLFVLMLPGLIFGGLTNAFSPSDPEIPILNSETAIIENANEITFTLNGILGEALDDVLARIEADFAASGADHMEVKNAYSGGPIYNANLFISQYCAAKDKDFESISLNDLAATLRENKQHLYSYTSKQEIRESTVTDPETGEETTVSETWMVYTVRYNGESYFSDVVFQLTDDQKELASDYASNLSLFLGDGLLQNLEAWTGNSITALGDVTFTDGITPVVYYNQLDERYAGKAYGTDNIGGYGCGPTAMAIVVSSLTDDMVDPVEMAEWSYNNGYWCKSSGSYHALIPAAAGEWGLPVSGCTTAEPQRITDALANGKLVVAIMSEGHFTSSGHFIVLRGVKDGKIMVADPASYTRSEQLWDLSIILNEASRRAGADEVLRLPLDQALIIIRGKKVLQVDKMDYSKHPEAKYLRSCKASAHVPEWRRLEEEAAKTPQPAPKPAPAAKKPAKRKATKPASPTDKSPKEAPAPKSAGTPEGIITTDKDSILS